MKKECQIVGDLLPLFAENMVSEASREFIEGHIKNCEACRYALAREEQDISVPAETDTKGLQGVKNCIRKRTVFPVLLSVFLALTLFAAMAVDTGRRGDSFCGSNGGWYDPR